MPELLPITPRMGVRNSGDCLDRVSVRPIENLCSKQPLTRDWHQIDNNEVVCLAIPKSSAYSLGQFREQALNCAAPGLLSSQVDARFSRPIKRRFTICEHAVNRACPAILHLLVIAIHSDNNTGRLIRRKLFLQELPQTVLAADQHWCTRYYGLNSDQAEPLGPRRH